MVELNSIQNKIIDYVQKMNGSVTYNQIKKEIAIPNKLALVELNEILDSLEINGFLYKNNEKYQLFSKYSDLAIGEIRFRNYAYIIIGKSQIILPPNFLNGALTGDIVVVKKNMKKIQGSSIATVEKILKRNNKGFIFDYINGEFKPYNWSGDIKLSIPNDQIKNITNGSRIVIKLSVEKNNNIYNGQIIDIVSHQSDPKLPIKTIASSKGIKISFTKEAYQQANRINQVVLASEIEERCKKGGLDLRNKTIFTIDGEGTKDMDDAVSIDKLSNGNYILGVHIADVSYYIKENSILDLEARDRSTSVYPHNCVIPMLPHILSNGICSLNPYADRLAFSCIMEISKTGEIINYKLVDTIINSKMKMSYQKINKIFEENIIDDDYQPFLYDLSLMRELSEILSKRKIDRGYISLNNSEIQFTEDGNVATKILKRKKGIAEKMIENFMLAANEATSSYYYWLKMPGIYRDHPAPDIDNLKEIINLLNLNISIPNTINNPHVIQNIINQIKKYDKNELYTELLIKSMKRAYYSTTNIGHFGLALNNYTHFTSPIRRYPDLATHRVLRQLRDDIVNINTKDQIQKLQSICNNANTQERIADKVERAATRYKIAEYVEQHINDTFTGYIIYISNNSVTIKTEEFISSKISMEDFRNNGYIFDENTMSLINNQNDIYLHLMDKIELIVKNVDKNTGKIEFQLKNDRDHIKIKK